MKLITVANLEYTAPSETHSMCVLDNVIYVVDGKKVLAMHVHIDTLWERMGKFLGIIKQVA